LFFFKAQIVVNSLRLLAKFETQKKGKVEVKRRPRIRRGTQNG